MDATEFDDSERWEDFFGSSTELVPSLLHIYDSLVTVMKNSHLDEGTCLTTNNLEPKYSQSPTTKLDQKKYLLTETTKVSKNYDYCSLKQELLSPRKTTDSIGADITNKQMDDLHQHLCNPPISISKEMSSTTNTSSSNSNLNSYSTSAETKIGTENILSKYSKYFPKSYEQNIDSRKMKSIVLKSENCPPNNNSTYGISETFKGINCRPLSAASICSINSTSSSLSSSSGTEHFSYKHNNFYLASVESLDDQSELKVTKLNPHMSTTTTVFERACQEIVDSEKNYVNDLGQVIQGYLRDWKERACLRCNELQILFSNIESIYMFNLNLLKKLLNSGLNPTKIAQCFIDLKEKFDVYTIYCTSYPEAIQLLTKLLQSTHTNALLTSTQKMLQHNLPLGSYLLKPVQRILKYHLLLDNLRKHCNNEEVVQAYEIMRQVARHIDQVKKKLEQQTRVRELSGILDGWLGPELTVLGELRLEGTLMESNKPRKVLLFRTMLIIAKAKEDSRLQFKSYIHQNNLMLSEHLVGEPCSFYVIPYDEPRNQIKLSAKNREQKRLWTQQIKSVILEKFDNIPLRAKELVYQLGNDDYHCTSDKSSRKWSLNTTSTPTYLERRSQHRRTEIRNYSKTTQKSESVRLSRRNAKDLVTDSVIYMGDSNLSQEIDKNASTNLDQTKSQAFVYKPSNNQINSNDNERECYEFVSSNGHLKRFLSFGHNPLKVKSKSVPQIGFYNVRERNIECNIASSFQPLNAKDQTNSVQLLYEQKILPNRIFTLRKCKRDNGKNTSIFYTSLDKLENIGTEKMLKITESTDSVASKDEIICSKSEKLQLSNAINANVDFSIAEKGCSEPLLMPLHSKCSRDEQIVRDLLKTSKQFDRHCLKLQKLRSEKVNLIKFTQLTDRPVTDKKLFIQNESDALLPPREPSRSPPPLENSTDKESTSDEPIYETLLRNVHVPYKFFPHLSKTQLDQQLQNQSNRKDVKLNDIQFLTNNTKKTLENKSLNQQLEADYVTLICSPYQKLEKYQPLANHVKVSARLVSLPTFTETSIIENNKNKCTNANNKNKMYNSQGKLILNSTDIELNSAPVKHIQSSSHKENIERYNILHKCRPSKLQTRSFLDYWRTTKATRSPVIHLPGSAAVGKRIAYVDNTNQSIFLQKSSFLHSYQFSNNKSSNQTPKLHYTITPSTVDRGYKTINKHNDEFNYEECVEACLEQEYRDSSVYRDDSDYRTDLPIIKNLYNNNDNIFS